MTRAISIAVLVATIAAGIWWYTHGAAEYGRKPKPPVSTKAEIRAKDGPYISTTKKLSDTEELSTLIVPSPLSEFLDVKCLIYKNREFRQVVMNCPGATQTDLETLDPQ